MTLLLILIITTFLILALILVPLVVLIAELVKCWWRATEEWREKKWRK